MGDWLNAPQQGLHTLLFKPRDAEAHEAGSSGNRDLPDVGFNRLAERINPTNRELRFTVPLTVDETYLGDIELAVSPQDLLSVDGARLLTLLGPVLTSAVRDHLAASLNAKGMLDQSALSAQNIRLVYDSANLALALGIPVVDRQKRALSLRDAREEQAETLRPAAFSAYLNVNARTEFVQAGSTRGFYPPVAALDFSARWRGVVFQNEGYLSGRSADPTFRRTGSRLIFDDLRHNMRWLVGDTQFQARQFQATPSVFGLGIRRLYNELEPQREIRSSGAQSFSLLSASMVETFVNGRSVERRGFQPGNYTLLDFPLAEGSNQIKLKIEDASGKVRFIDFSAYANQSLLRKGLTEFSAFGGVYANPTIKGFAYSRDWIGGGFIRSGLTDRLTAGANFQINRQVRQAGAEILWGSPLGLAGFSLSASNASGRGNGLAAAITFERLLSYSVSGRSQSIRTSIEWRSKRFVIPEVEFGPGRTELRASAGYVRNFANNSFIAADVQFSRDRFPREQSWGARLSGGVDLIRHLAATAEFGVTRGNSRDETYVRLGVRLNLGGRGSIQLDADTRGRARASYSNSGGNGIGAWQTSAEISQDRDSISLTADASLATNRAELGVQQTGSFAKGGMQLTDARMSLHAAFAVAFAGGAFAVGRPVSEAFVIARAHRSLKGKQVYLDPLEKSETARSGRLGPALNGQLGAYNFRTLIYQVPDAPSGYDLGAGNVAIKPPYRGGYALTIGSDYNLLVIGTLLDLNGEPVKLLAGSALDMEDRKHPALTVFTSRDGRFGAQGLRPGRWRIEMPSEPPLAYEFEVADSADSIVRVGELRPFDERRKK